ncbi:AAA family ATPase [Paenibacillus polymyxa]|uniref:Uncharacterized protein n=1 Tax=Paenibacillus polymyxa (strain SC2) TaxID=886882 RepID=E3EJR6_PAEPS|nr:AAA family ATPase [Paenibacillus polymyxa]ADO59664.1 hypothetical protein PPSC2_26800 [Paenibacillus polymyxa SC2]WPQ59509.1 AAA family ATPase [Paenibacillus polymyxa]
MKLEKAINLATLVFAEKKDKQGRPLIFHPLRVAMGLTTEEEQVTAILLSAMQSSMFTKQMLFSVGISRQVAEALDDLMIRNEESLEKFAERIRCSDLAKKVEIAFLKDLKNEGLLDDQELKKCVKMLEILMEDKHENLKRVVVEHEQTQANSKTISESQLADFFLNYQMFVGVQLNKEQEEAVRLALTAKTCLIQGQTGEEIVQIIDVILKGLKKNTPYAHVGMVSGGTMSERECLKNQIHFEVEDIREADNLYFYDVIIVHAFSQVDPRQLIRMYGLFNPKTRIIFIDNTEQTAGENGVDISQFPMIPSVTLTKLLKSPEILSMDDKKLDRLRNVTAEQGDAALHNGDSQKLEFIELLTKLSNKPVANPLRDEVVESAIDNYEQARAIRLSTDQKNAIEQMLQNRVLLLTGAPGSGLTETVKGIVECTKHIDGESVIRLYGDTPYQSSYFYKRIGVSTFKLPSDLDSDGMVDLYIIDSPEEMNKEDLIRLVSHLEDLDYDSRVLIVGNPHAMRDYGFDVQAMASSFPVMELKKLRYQK